jgi:hypothetical protein
MKRTIAITLITLAMAAMLMSPVSAKPKCKRCIPTPTPTTQPMPTPMLCMALTCRAPGK